MAVSTTGLAAGRGPTAIFHLSKSVTSFCGLGDVARSPFAWRDESMDFRVSAHQFGLDPATRLRLPPHCDRRDRLGAAVTIVVIIFLSAGAAGVRAEVRRTRKPR